MKGAGQLTSMILPGWDSVEAVTRIHRFFEVGGIVCLGLLVVFEAFSYLYGHRRDVLAEAAQGEHIRQALDESRKEAARLKSEYELQMGILKSDTDTARTTQQETAKELAILKERNSPRSLSKPDREKLLAQLQMHKGCPIVVRHSPNLESQGFAEQISSVLVSAGWTLNPTPFRIIEKDATGLFIIVNDMKKAPEGATILQGALKSIGLVAPGAANPSVADGTFELYVGQKPVTN